MLTALHHVWQGRVTTISRFLSLQMIILSEINGTGTITQVMPAINSSSMNMPINEIDKRAQENDDGWDIALTFGSNDEELIDARRRLYLPQL